MASDTPKTDAVCPHLNLSHSEMRDMAWKLRDHARTLERDLSAARAECEEQARLNGMGSEREAKLMAECERLRKDAERYSFLRNFIAPEDYYAKFPRWTVSCESGGMGQVYNKDTMDAAIDAAIARADIQSTQPGDLT